MGTPLCFGDGTGTPCPCGNTGANGTGCANSESRGATLAGSGSASVAANSLAFSASAQTANQPALLFAGENAVNGGAGVTFGDGLRCAGGNLKRLGVRQSNAQGNVTWGPNLNGNWTAGDTRVFQSWYRDPLPSPCATGFNLSHGVSVTFAP